MSKLAFCIDPQNSCFHDLDFIWSECLCIVDVTREQGPFCFFTCPLTLLKAHCVDWRNSIMSQIMKMLSQCFVIKLCQGARFLLVSNQCISYWAYLRLDSLWLRAWCWSGREDMGVWLDVVIGSCNLRHFSERRSNKPSWFLWSPYVSSDKNATSCLLFLVTP